MKKLTLKSKILIIVLICSMMAILPIAIVSVVNNIKASYIQAAASPTDINGDGEYDYRIDGHTQTFEIYNLLGLKKFRDNVNGGTTYKDWQVSLENNIENVGDFGSPIGLDDKTFDGTFNGKGHYLSGITALKGDPSDFLTAHVTYIGFFGTVSGLIKNLMIKNSSISVTVDVGRYIISGIMIARSTNNIENCMVKNCNFTINISGNDFWNYNRTIVGMMVGYFYGTITNSAVINSSVKINEVDGSNDYTTKDIFYFGGIIGASIAYDFGELNINLKNCFASGVTYDTNGASIDNGQSGKGALICGRPVSNAEDIYGMPPTTATNCFAVSSNRLCSNDDQSLFTAQNTLRYDSVGSWNSLFTTHNFNYSYGTINTSKNWYLPKSNEYNGGLPIQTVFVDYETYEVKTVENSDQQAIDKGTVNISSFSIPIPKDDPSTKYTGIPDNNSPNQAFVVEVIGQNVIATPACETCRQFSHWEVNGKTLIAHFKAKEVPANCTVKFNGHSYANTTSNISLYEFKLHPGSTIKCVESNNGRKYTYIVVKGGDCPDCDRSLTTGEEYARITYTIKIDPGQPASKYELDSLDSGGFIKKTNVLYTITKSITISPTFILKEYDIEIG